MSTPGAIDTRATTQIAHIPDHRYKAKYWMMWQFRDKTRIVAIAQALAQGAQVMEEICFGFLPGLLLDLAIGDQLDKLGALVGEPRDGLPDRHYRRFISARILTNRCSGKTDELIRIFQLVTSPSTVRSWWMFPAGLSLYADRTEPMSPAVLHRVARMMADAQSAGISLELVETVSGSFGWDGQTQCAGYNRGYYSRSIR